MKKRLRLKIDRMMVPAMFVPDIPVLENDTPRCTALVDDPELIFDLNRRERRACVEKTDEPKTVIAR